jgi:hypothetical protein
MAEAGAPAQRPSHDEIVMGACPVVVGGVLVEGVGARLKAIKPHGCRRALGVRELALPLQCLGMLVSMAGCLNPSLPAFATSSAANHAPEVTFSPLPGPAPIDILNGRGCPADGPSTVGVIDVHDDDGDPITVRFDIAFEVADGVPVRNELRESPPLPVLEGGTYPVGELTRISTNRDALAQFLPLGEQEGKTQLIEARVTDGRFVRTADGNIDVAEGALVYMSWATRVLDVPDCAVNP